jgi:RNA polymerase sigma-70 factor, ECF subfamily
MHTPTVLRTAQRLLLNEADAQDATQEVFLKLYRSFSKFNQERELLPWLYRITANVCHDLRRKRKPVVAMEQIAEPAATGCSPEEEMSRAERWKVMTAALAILSERERDAIVLRDLESLSTREVANALGITEGTVRSQISTGRAKLKEYVMRKGRSGA